MGWIHETRVDQLALVNDLILLMSDQECLDHTYQSEVKSLRETGWDSEAAAGGRQWIYQTCTEFGWYQSSDTPDQSWGSIIPVSFFEKMCQDVYGPKFTLDLLKRGIRATNIEYGGLDIQVSNVVFMVPLILGMQWEKYSQMTQTAQQYLLKELLIVQICIQSQMMILLN